jgi:hypothetical protein
MKQKSDYAFITGCSNAYSFGLLSTMNAQNYFKTNADWEIVYDELWDPKHRERISNAFPFNVSWYLQEDMNNEFKHLIVDKRTDKTYPIDPWYSVLLLANKILKEGKYKAICILQADQFVFVNLDSYFKMAEAGIFLTGEFPFSFANIKDMPFGNDKGIWDRSMCPAFDSINLYGPQYADVPLDVVRMQLEDSFRGESTHPMICHNRSICKHVKKENIIGLDRLLWVCDSMWAETTLRIGPTGYIVFNHCNIPLRGWHCRWWAEGRIMAEFERNKQPILDNRNNIEHINTLNRLEHNYNLIKSFMEKFNDMIPEIKSDIYVKGFVKRPKYELGEQ